MSIPLEQLDKLAYLAQLALAPADKPRIAAQLASIIGMVEAVSEADTANVAPLTNPLDRTVRLRADEVTESDLREHMQAVAPAARDGFYLVPRVVE